MRLSGQDIRLAVRSFARQPGFTTVAVLSLALAIALNTTMYSVLDAMIKPRLDVDHPEQLYVLEFFGDRKGVVGVEARRELLHSSPVVDGDTYASGVGYLPTTVELNNELVEARVLGVSPEFFGVLRATPKRGRFFDATDEADAFRPVVISENLAEKLSPKKEFPVGHTVAINGALRPVIGIFASGSVPRGSDVIEVREIGPVVGNLVRLRDGVTPDQATRAFALLSARFALLAGIAPREGRVAIKSLLESQFSPQGFHYALAAAVIAVLLVACANLANLQLARGIGRSRELAVRAALGASRSAIIRQLMLESTLLALVGLATGVLLTFWGVYILKGAVPPAIADYVVEPQISWRVFAFATGAAGVCVLLIGLVPAIRVSRVDPNTLLKSGAGTGALRAHRRTYGFMVATEIALALALLSGASLVARTAIEVRSLDIGFDPRPITAATVYLQSASATTTTLTPYINDLLSHVRAVPNVASAAVWTYASPPHRTITVEGGQTTHEQWTLLLSYKLVTADYFRTVGLRVTRGHDFPDGGASIPEVIIDEHTARSLFPGIDPIGRQIKFDSFDSPAPWLRIVGVVPTVNDYTQLTLYGFAAKSSRIGDIYRLATVSDSTFVPSRWYSMLGVMVRAAHGADRMPVILRHAIVPTGFVKRVLAQPLEEEMGIRRERQRHDFVASIFVLFAVFGIALAALGIYGIVAHSVAERTRELGVRIALGATTRDILHAVLREGNVIALAGVAVGLLLTKYSAGWLHAFIFEGDEYSVEIFAIVGATLFAVAFLSALGPALRASRVDPVESLRSE